MAHIGTDLSKTKAQESFEPVPPGEYVVQITDSGVVQTKTTGANMLKVTLSIAVGPFAGRKIFDNFVLGHDVAMSRLKSMAIAGQHPHPDFLNDSEELHGLSLMVKVKLTSDPNYSPQNKIISFHAIKGAQAPQATQAPSAPAPSFRMPAPQSVPPAAPVALAPAPAPLQAASVGAPAPAPVAPVAPSTGKMPWEM